jgi:proteasome accessory factor A
MGQETEYAALVDGPQPGDLRALFEGWTPPYRAQWDQQPERPWCDARGFVPAAAAPQTGEPPVELLSAPEQRGGSPGQDDGVSPTTAPLPQIEVENLPGMMLDNGARFYLDHTHPEWSTPECATPLEVVAYDKAGDAWLNDLVGQFNASRAGQGRITVYKNNVDAFGNSYGCHENYLMDASAYTALFDRQAHRLYTTLIPFLVTRQIICGAGKVAAVGSDGEMGFQISQRADVFESILGLQTTHRRPIINTRDEPHADPMRFRRLHVIVGDSNLSEYSTFLKFGSTALVLEMLAANRPRLDLTLADPLCAVRLISRDPTCKVTIEMETGGRRFTALDIQRCFVDEAEHYLEEQGDETYRRDVLQAWREAIDGLSDSPAKLASRIDWAIKYDVLKTQMELRGWTWDTPQVRELDVKYHQIDPQRSLFHLLLEKGLIERLLDEQAVDQARRRPPAGTRAHLRVACLNRYPNRTIAVNWDTLVFVGEQDRVWRWRWPDPTYNGGAEIESLLLKEENPERLVLRMLANKQSNRREFDGN